MDSSILLNVFVFLAAAAIVVPLAGRFRLGAVLGYLAAGILIGPFGLALIENPEEVLHFAEFGIVMMLFLIGLELDPETLWRMRKAILGLGGLQVVLTSTLLASLGVALGFAWPTSLAAGLALSLSSTALVLQLLEEKGILHTSAGESSFAVLLFQDIAVIPILVALPLLAAGGEHAAGAHATPLAGLPGPLQAAVVLAVIAAIVMGGRYLSRHLFRFIAKTGLREVFTATSLALVVGITLLMQAVGVSPALGAFVAGVVLANSEYKQTLETDIMPFKGLLLGLFFISIGMGIDFGLLARAPLDIAAIVGALVLLKALVLFVLARSFGVPGQQASVFALALAQGGEFAFVLFQFALGLGLLDGEQSAVLTLSVALSMAATPLLMTVGDRFLVARFMSRLPERPYDTIADDGSAVIIAGYGRFGQIVGRFLTAQGVKTTILEKDPDQVAFVRRFGSPGYFGDASRLDLLENAGAARAKLLIIAIDDADKALEIARFAKSHFPKLAILARARNRRHAYELDKLGVEYFRRELFDASLSLAVEAMRRLGAKEGELSARAQRFMAHDEETLKRSFAFFEKEPELISFTRQANGEMERILQEDVRTET